MPKVNVKVGQGVKNRCPVCGKMGVEFPVEPLERLNTLAKLRSAKKIEVWCDGCNTDFWFYLRTGKVTIKKIDKSYVA